VLSLCNRADDLPAGGSAIAVQGVMQKNGWVVSPVVRDVSFYPSDSR